MRLAKHSVICSLLAATALIAAPAHAAYTLTPLKSGTNESSVNVLPGNSFAVDFVLTSNNSDVSKSAIFRPTLSASGLILQTYQWQGGYVNATSANSEDKSTPNVVDQLDGRPVTPTAITDTTYTEPGVPGAGSPIDANMTNVQDGTFGVGNLVTLTFQVPAGWTGPNLIALTAVPDTFANGFVFVPTTAGPAFTINVVPEPGSLGVAALLAGGLLARRRRKA